MKRIITALLMGVFAMAGCNTMQDEEVDVRIESSSRVQFYNVSVHRKEDNVYVTGMLRPVSSSISRTGHVDVDFIGIDGEVLRTVRVKPNMKIFSRNSTRRPVFSTEVKQGQVLAVRLTHHANTIQRCEY